MKVFISWSGEQSRQVADVLRDWLPLVIQAVKPWVSKADIQKGEAWFSAIQESLSEAKGMGIFCLTPENLTAPWLAFEAGALSIHDKGRVATLLYNVETTSLTPPLSLFQATKSDDKADVLGLLQSINSRLEEPLESTLLQRSFDANWAGLVTSMKTVTKQSIENGKVRARPEEMLEEILNTVRRLERDSEGIFEKKAREITSGLNLKIYGKPTAGALTDYFLTKVPAEHEITSTQKEKLGIIASAIEEYHQASPNSRRRVLLDDVDRPDPEGTTR